MNVGDKIVIRYGEFQDKIGQIKTRHMNAVPREMKNIKPGVTIDNRNNETLYSVLIEGEKDIMYFPQSCLELITG